jgi:hypothetical protein
MTLKNELLGALDTALEKTYAEKLQQENAALILIIRTLKWK